MKRTYLEEDLEQIRKYFPGARAVALRTPFDLSRPGRRPGITLGSFRDTDEPDSEGWTGGVVWNH